VFCTQFSYALNGAPLGWATALLANIRLYLWKTLKLIVKNYAKKILLRFLLAGYD